MLDNKQMEHLAEFNKAPQQAAYQQPGMLNLCRPQLQHDEKNRLS